MPIYAWICDCGITDENRDRLPPQCKICKRKMRRDWRTEGVTNTFHVTRDLYLEKKKRDAKKSHHIGDYYRSRGRG